MRRAVPILALGMIALAINSAAQAQFRNHADICIAGTGKLDVDVSFCSLALKSGDHNELTQATLFAHRGRARLELGDHRGAVQDLDAAIELNPGSAMAHNQRGRAYHKAGDNARAEKAYNKAIELFPRFGAAFRNRGTAKLFQGKLQDALADFDTAIGSANYDPASHILRGIANYLRGDFRAAIPDLSAAMELGYPYPEAVLWIYLSERYLGRDAIKNLILNAEDMVGSEWPRPLIDVYLGKASDEAALEAASHPNDLIERRRLSAANFYLGAFTQRNGKVQDAKAFYEAVIRLAAQDSIERAAAIHELAKLPP